MMLPEKTVYDKLSAKVNNIDSSKFVLKAKYDTDKSNLEKKISDADKKFPLIVDLLKKQIMMLKSLKQKSEYLVLVI